MCLARCPLGGHFATGSDDGLGRVWADDDDERINTLDRERSGFNTKDDAFVRAANSIARRRKRPNPTNGKILLTLRIPLLSS